MTLKQREYFRRWRSANREKMNAYNRQWRLDHLDYARAKDRLRDRQRTRIRPNQKAYLIAYRAKHRQRIVARQLAFYYANRERLLKWKREHPPDKEHKRTYNREWCRRNPGRTKAQRLRRTTNVPIVNPEAIDEMIRRVRALPEIPYAYCECVVSGQAMDIDHVIPLSRGGIHCVSNLLPACKRCNRTKHNKTLEEWEVPSRL